MSKCGRAFGADVVAVAGAAGFGVVVSAGSEVGAGDAVGRVVGLAATEVMGAEVVGAVVCGTVLRGAALVVGAGDPVEVLAAAPSPATVMAPCCD